MASVASRGPAHVDSLELHRCVRVNLQARAVVHIDVGATKGVEPFVGVGDELSTQLHRHVHCLRRRERKRTTGERLKQNKVHLLEGEVVMGGQVARVVTCCL